MDICQQYSIENVSRRMHRDAPHDSSRARSAPPQEMAATPPSPAPIPPGNQPGEVELQLLAI
jgi:hypothetical protein